MRLLSIAASAALALAPVLVPVPAQAALTHNFVEDFSSDAYCDTLHTTAEWNTAAGTLGLPPFTMSDIGFVTTPGSARDVQIWGDMLIVADGDAGVQIIDVTYPSNPTLLGIYDTSGSAREVEVDGDVVYVADDVAGIVAVDITDPSNPAYLGGANTPGTVLGIALDGDHLYVADGTQGIKAYDVSDPASPALDGTYFIAGTAFNIDVEGDYAYVCYGATGLIVVDVSDPANMVPVATLDTPGIAVNVTVEGGCAYIADSASGLQIADVSDPTDPILIGALATGTAAVDIDVEGPFAHVAVGGLQDLWLVDVSDPSAPAVLGYHGTPGASSGVVVDGTTAYVAGNPGSVSAVEIAQFVGPFLGTALEGFAGGGVYAAGTRLYVGAGEGMRIYDTADPANPNLLGSVVMPENSRAIEVVGHFAFVAARHSGLQVIDVSDAANPQVVGSCGAGYDDFSGIDVAGDVAYIPANGILVTCNVQDPTDPSVAGAYLSQCLDFALAGDTGYYVLDLAYEVFSASVDGAYVYPLDQVDIDIYPTDIAVSGDMAYAADEGMLRYIDVSDPTNLYDTEQYGSAPFAPLEMEIVGDRIFMAGLDNDLLVTGTNGPVDYFGGPLHPHGRPVDLAVAGDYLFATGEAGLAFIEILQRKFETTAGEARSLDVAGSAYTVRKVRLSTSQADSVAWWLSADDGATWQSFAPDGEWHGLTTAGTGLRWRSSHAYKGLGVDPACTEISIDWLYDFGTLDAVRDVPNDQGRQARLSWTRSAHDFVGDPSQVTGYAVYRRIDEWTRDTNRAAARDAVGDGVLYPPGDWEYVVTVPACCEDVYATIVPTVCDSTVEGGMCESSFFVRALTATPGVHFDSPPETGYSVDNLAPSPPLGLLAEGDASSVDLAWDVSEDEDFDYYTVYRSTDPEFSAPELLGYTSDSEFTDEEPPSASEWWYRVTATDFAGNESGPSDPASVTGTGVDELDATRFRLAAPVPNPAAGGATLQYSVPESALGDVVRLGIYDSAGRLVRTLIDGPQSPGVHTALWDGRDTSGSEAASGVYFCRMECGTFTAAKKLIVLR